MLDKAWEEGTNISKIVKLLAVSELMYSKSFKIYMGRNRNAKLALLGQLHFYFYVYFEKLRVPKTPANARSFTIFEIF